MTIQICDNKSQLETKDGNVFLMLLLILPYNANIFPQVLIIRKELVLGV